MPVRQGHASVEDFAGLELILLRAPPPPSPPTRSVALGILGSPALLYREQGQMEVTARLLRGRGEHAGHGAIGALQGCEPKLGWCVGMLEGINQLLGGGIVRAPLRGAPSSQQRGNAGLPARIVGRLG